MAEENDWEGGTNADKATASTSHSVMEIEKAPENTDSKQQADSKKEKEESSQTVPLYKLFSFADSLDHLLMIVGTIAAAGNGISMPLMTILFGDLINSFGKVSNPTDMVHEVSKVSEPFSFVVVLFLGGSM